MPVPRNTSRTETVIRGINEFLIIDATPAGAESLKGLPIAGQTLNVQGNYDCYVDVPGVSSLDVYLTPSAVANTVTPSAFITYADKATSKTPISGFSAFSGTTAQSGTGTLKGEQRVIVRIAVGASGSVILTRAEVNGL